MLMDEPKEVEILFLGDAEAGKSAFLSYVYRSSLSGFNCIDLSKHILISLHSRMLQGPNASPNALKDSNQPFVLDLKSSRQGSHRLAFSDTAAPTHYTQQRPNLIVLCFDISRKSTLVNVQQRWRPFVEKDLNLHERHPILLLGLKRDLRVEMDSESVMPQEAMRVAGEMRVDRYAETSAKTGECWDVCVQDVLGMAVRSLRSDGGRTEGANCVIL